MGYEKGGQMGAFSGGPFMLKKQKSEPSFPPVPLPPVPLQIGPFPGDFSIKTVKLSSEKRVRGVRKGTPKRTRKRGNKKVTRVVRVTQVRGVGVAKEHLPTPHPRTPGPTPTPDPRTPGPGPGPGPRPRTRTRTRIRTKTQNATCHARR